LGDKIKKINYTSLKTIITFDGITRTFEDDKAKDIYID
jgi:hypothetical protein